MKLFKNRKKGFTIIELIVVIAILGILAAILIPQFGNFREKAAENAVLSEARSVATAVDAYYALEGEWPEDDTAKAKMVTDKYLTQALADKTTLAAGGAFTYGDAERGYQAVRGTEGEFTVSEYSAP